MLVRSYRTVSPLPVLTFQQEAEPSAVCFLWHCPASHLDWPLASTVALWSPDLPQCCKQHCGHPANSPSRYRLVADLAVDDAQRFYEEHEGVVGINAIRRNAIGVSDLWRQDDLSDLADSHADHALLQARQQCAFL